MINTLKKLIELQSVDADIFALRKEQNNIPNKLRKKKAEFDQTVVDFHQKKENKKNLAVEIDKVNLDIASEEVNTKDLQSKQALVKKNKEYQALTNEIKASVQKKSNLENSLEKKLVDLEDSSTEFTENQSQVKKVKTELLQEADKAKKEIEDFNLKINKYKLLRKEITKEINPEVLALYNMLLKTRAPTVVVKANNNVCEGCHINLTAQVIVDIKKADRLVTCENCARILYIENE